MTEDESNQDDCALLVAPAQLDNVPNNLDHETLKYHLLGPSLTKAGQDTVDQRKVSEIIYEASKGSKYFNNEEVKDKVLTQKIERILARKKQVEKLDLSTETRHADERILQLELSRDLSQYVVHVDCDAFYAAVEELDRPDLKDVPFAVGKGVLTTCNYHARKFGCRSGMAGFVAMKLCPQLICLPLNFEKYTAKAQEIRAILAIYDPRFESSSIDEAYLNITQYCEDHDQDPEQVVEEMRARVHEETKITVSAGIAANARLAKICSNVNKPNGQFRIANDRSVIVSYMSSLPTRKVNGVGRVFERELDAVGIKTCGDIYGMRAYLSKLFGEKAFEFLIAVHLGLGKTDIRPAEEYERKSVGTESTFHDIYDRALLRAKLRHTAEELEKDMTRTQFKGRTLVLKIKLHTYEVFTRQIQPPLAIWKADDLYRYSVPMLSKLEKEIPGMNLRLMGLRMTHLVSMKKEGDVDFFGMGKLVAKNVTEQQQGQEPEWEQWPEDEFEEAARRERQDEMDAVEALSQEYERLQANGVGHFADPDELRGKRRRHGKEILPNPVPASTTTHSEDALASKLLEDEIWACPVCGRPQAANDRSFNQHIDLCLSRQTITDAVKETGGISQAEKVEEEEKEEEEEQQQQQQQQQQQPLQNQQKRTKEGPTLVSQGRKRSRLESKVSISSRNTQKKLFFS